MFVFVFINIPHQITVVWLVKNGKITYTTSFKISFDLFLTGGEVKVCILENRGKKERNCKISFRLEAYFQSLNTKHYNIEFSIMCRFFGLGLLLLMQQNKSQHFAKGAYTKVASLSKTSD